KRRSQVAIVTKEFRKAKRRGRKIR
uniref:Uncharacterized protein n=1 Tax=Caenorhabditis japonica TaxID=281687 RepID=A0A8R1IP65_CAEJA